MASTIQFKRRISGNAGAPAALRSGEVAHNEVDNTLYIGQIENELKQRMAKMAKTPPSFL